MSYFLYSHVVGDLVVSRTRSLGSELCGERVPEFTRISPTQDSARDWLRQQRFTRICVVCSHLWETAYTQSRTGCVMLFWSLKKLVWSLMLQCGSRGSRNQSRIYTKKFSKHEQSFYLVTVSTSLCWDLCQTDDNVINGCCLDLDCCQFVVTLFSINSRLLSWIIQMSLISQEF